jgi:hypothetical protein
MSKTVKLYIITCTKAYRMDEQGTRVSLEPWQSNSIYYDGYDDGGHDYILPDGYHVARANDEMLHIYRRDKSQPETLMLVGHTPAIIDTDGNAPRNIFLARA